LVCIQVRVQGGGRETRKERIAERTGARVPARKGGEEALFLSALSILVSMGIYLWITSNCGIFLLVYLFFLPSHILLGCRNGANLVVNKWTDRSLPSDAYWPLTNKNTGAKSGLAMPWELLTEICVQTNTECKTGSFCSPPTLPSSSLSDWQKYSYKERTCTASGGFTDICVITNMDYNYPFLKLFPSPSSSPSVPSCR
jgi:hypothetical protein